MSKKSQQLGMPYGTAAHRLLKDILFDFVEATERDRCFRCGRKMERDNFSIDHKIPWLDSKNPIELYFDTGNIEFSHLKCNIGAARKPTKLNLSNAERKVYDRKYNTLRARKNYSKERRHQKWIRTGN